MIQKANFNAGPAILPQMVDEKLRHATFDFEGTGLPVWSVSHRSAEFKPICAENVKLVKELLGVPNGHSVLFCPGGATAQFKAWLLNMKRGKKVKVGFVDSGHWSSMAIKAARELEAGGFGKAIVLASSQEHKYRMMPKGINTFGIVESGLDFVYFTTNETINGTQTLFPHTLSPHGWEFVADMTSDIMSRPLDISKYGLIFASAQKNLGIAGITLIIVRDDLIGEGHFALSAPLSYAEQKKAEGALRNTPNTFALYSIYCMLTWIKESGGVMEMMRRAFDKSGLMYRMLNKSDAFELIPLRDCSMMNVVFRLRDQSKHDKFLELCKRMGIVGIEGHRGANELYGPHLRASLYIGQTMENVHRLLEVMHTFEKSP